MTKLVLSLLSYTLILTAIAVSYVAINDRYQLGINASGSLPESVYIIDKEQSSDPFNLEDIVVFNFDGRNWGFPQDYIWAKKIAGLPGEKISIIDNQIMINNRFVVRVNLSIINKHNLQEAKSDYIPADKYFVVGSNQDSFDSRYLEFGLLDKTQIIGKAKILW